MRTPIMAAGVLAAILTTAPAHAHVPKACEEEMQALLANMMAKAAHSATAQAMGTKMAGFIPTATKAELREYLAELADWTSKFMTLDNAVTPAISAFVQCVVSK